MVADQIVVESVQRVAEFQHDVVVASTTLLIEATPAASRRSRNQAGERLNLHVLNDPGV
jgi:hypothetical protein